MTPVPVARLHKDAILGFLRALPTPPAGVGVYDANVPATPPAGPHIVVYSDPGKREAPSMALDYRRVTTTHQLTCVGGSMNECLYAADRAAELLGTWLTASGRRMEPVRFLGSTPGTRDDATRDAGGRPLFSAVLDVAVTSQPT